ncbi:HNH endonuclease signature motif containing protein [Microbacterium sp.]|uniref:HNH endonuclease signature motif containing protein n=1 Tax=Microbacterium sp. TaxID=51671 RepID=UPI003A8D51FB
MKATVQVTIGASTLMGADDAMGELNGHGPIAPDAVRLLAGQAGSWDRAFLDARGMVVETDNYVPTAGMKRYLRARDQHCRFPGCRTPAHRCQIDHNHDHAKGGPTALSNLSLFCTSHHPLKHPDVDDRDRWTAKQLDDGVVLWTSPLGRTYTDEPPLRVMFT